MWPWLANGVAGGSTPVTTSSSSRSYLPDVHDSSNGHGLVGRVDDSKALESPPIEAPVAGQELVGLQERVGTDQEVGDDPGAGTSSPSIGTPGIACPTSRRFIQSIERDRHPFQQRGRVRCVGECCEDLGPDHLTRNDDPSVEASTERGPRCRTETRCGGEDIDEDVRNRPP